MGTSVCPTRRTTLLPFIHDGRQRRAADRGGHPPRAAPPRVRDPVRLRPPSRRRQLGRALPLAPRARPSGLRRAPAARRWGRRARRPVTDAPTRSGLPPPPPSRPRACCGRRAVGATPMSCGAARSGRGGLRLGGRGRSPARPGGGAHGRGGGGAERPARRAPAARRRRARVDARRGGLEVGRHGASWRLASERVMRRRGRCFARGRSRRGVSSLCLFWITQVKCGSPESSIPAYLPTVFSSSDERSVQKHAGGL